MHSGMGFTTDSCSFSVTLHFSQTGNFLNFLTDNVMKKSLLFGCLFLAGAASAQDCSELFISEYVEGSGNNKALEFYNPTNNDIDLSVYKVSRFSNGSSLPNAGGETMLSGTIAAHSTWVLVNGQTTTTSTSPAASLVLQGMADQLDHDYPAPTYMNGNDAIVLYKNDVIVDIFGKTGDAAMTNSYGWSDEYPYDGSAGEIWTENHTLIRKATVLHGVTANPDPFIVTQEWDSLPEDTWSNLGVHTCNCTELGVQTVSSNVSFAVYPNPAADGYFVVSANETLDKITVVNALGQIVYSEEVAGLVNNRTINTSDLPKGVYVVKISYKNQQSSTAQLVIK